MGTLLSLLANPVVVQIALSLIETFAKAKGVSDEQKQVFVKMSQVLRDLGAKQVTSGFAGEDRQSQDIDQAWKDANAPKADNK